MSNSNAWILRFSWLVFSLLAVQDVTRAQEVLWAEGFAKASDWQKRESRHQEKIVTEGISVDIQSLRDGSRPGPFLRLEDRSPRDHWFWLHRRKAQGAWDLSRATRITLWSRSNGAKSVLRFLVGDNRGNVAYYTLGNVENRAWTQTSLDLRRTPPFNTVGAVDWCCVTLVGLRTDAGHGYRFDFHDLRIEAEEDRYVTGVDAEGLLRPALLGGAPLGFLAPVSSSDLSDSMVGLNLTGNVEETDLDRIAQAGVKWAKLSCFMPRDDSARTERLVDALLARRIQVVGQLPQTLPWSKELFPDVQGAPGERVPIAYSPKAMAWFQERVRHGAERLKGRVGVWEIGNEPDIPKFWMPTPDPAAFGTFVTETSKALKSVDPRNKVISGGVCGFWGADFSGARRFLTTFFETGVGAHIDILGLHPYRSHPESGAANMTQRQVADELRSLMGRFGLSLPLWDTEWQITGAVDRSEVPYATDLAEAKGMLRKYLVEAHAGFMHMNWQIAKATLNMDHPGQIFAADGRPTAKYVTLRHTGALFARIASPLDIPVRLAKHSEEPGLVLLAQHGFDEPAALQDWKATAGALVDNHAAFRGKGALKLSGGHATRIDTAKRWRSVLGATFIEVRGVLKGDGCDVAIRPSPCDAQGNELPPPRSPKTPFRTRPEYTPFCSRFPVEGDWHDFGLRIELPKGGTAHVDEVRLAYPISPPEIVSFAFRLHGSKTPAVFYWNPARPSDRQPCRTVDLAIQGGLDGELVLLNTFTGEIRPLERPQPSGDEILFRNLPLCDYPLAIARRDAFPSAPTPAWLAAFADADDIVDRSFRDRTGDFYLRGFWSGAFDLVECTGIPGEASAKLTALRRVRSLWRTFPITPQPIAVQPAAPLRMTLRPASGAWRDSTANLRSRNVNRFFYPLDDADVRATVHGVKIAERTLPERPWADSPDNAFTWFFLRRDKQRSEVFVVVPKGQNCDRHDIAIDLSRPPRAQAVLLSSRALEAQCVGYWTEAMPGQENGVCSIELEDHNGWSSGVVLVNPRTGAVCGKAAVKRLEGGRVLLEVPPAPQPLLLLPQQLLPKVMDALRSHG